MPFYTLTAEEGFIPDTRKALIAREIVRIHTTIMHVPKSFVRTVFMTYPRGSGFIAGESAPTAALICILREGHSEDDKANLLKQLWTLLQEQTGLASEQLAISLQEVAASNAMEMGQTMGRVGAG